MKEYIKKRKRGFVAPANLLDACKLTYRKHVMNDPNIGWEELSDYLCDALCNEIGDAKFVVWADKQN